MGRCCTVPGCTTNYRSNKEGSCSTFIFPRDKERREKWNRAINRPGFVPTKFSSVCAKHFSEECIIRIDTAKRADGSILTVRRSLPKLTEDAIPTIFPRDPLCESQSTSATVKSSDERKQLILQKDEMDFKEWSEENKILDSEDLLGSIEEEAAIKAEPFQDPEDGSTVDAVSKFKAEPESVYLVMPEVKIEPEDKDKSEDAKDDAENVDNKKLSVESTLSEGYCTDAAEAFRRFYHCPYCELKVTEPLILAHHVFCCHPGKKPFVCPECKRGFMQWLSLCTHIHKHTLVPTQKAKTAMPQPGKSLKPHMALHTDRKRKHNCPICDQAFLTLGSLNYHVLIHTPNKAFICNKCDKSFTSAAKLKRHKLFHNLKNCVP